MMLGNGSASLVESSSQRSESSLPPMLVQYLELKEQYPDYLLFFQVGDFYELFFNDAVKAAGLLNLTLTSRDKNETSPVPMAGVPLAVLDSYLSRLLSVGVSAAIVSQRSSKDASGKTVIKRELERIVTPGVSLLATGFDTVLGTVASIVPSPDQLNFSIAVSDVQSGALYVSDEVPRMRLVEELRFVEAVEFVVPGEIAGSKFDRRTAWVHEIEQVFGENRVRFIRAGMYGFEQCRLRELPAWVGLSSSTKLAVGALVNYLDTVTVGTQLVVHQLLPRIERDIVAIDANTRRTLELVANFRDGSIGGSLLEYLSLCLTPGGRRLLRRWVISPAKNLTTICERQDLVEVLLKQTDLRHKLRELLLRCPDLERLVSRLELGVLLPSEAGALRDGLEKAKEAFLMIDSINASTNLSALANGLNPSNDLLGLLLGLAANPPAANGKPGIFSDHYKPELKEIRSLRNDGSAWLSAFEETEKLRTGIGSLKVRSNNVIGFYIEITKSNIGKVPSHYIKRQGTLNAERFSTPELSEKEGQILSAEDSEIQLEKELFENLRTQLMGFTRKIRAHFQALSYLDVVLALSELAERDALVRPELNDSAELEITLGKHPVSARLLHDRFTPNSLNLSKAKLALLTGPNMGGKSTFLRQTALICIMAQIGSFVPAAKAKIGLVDRIFARMGAADDLLEGSSTFMLEMKEVAHILSSATEKSLVLVDEVGRGTASRDGLAIAQSLLEWLALRIQCRTLFATHFYDLTSLEGKLKGVFNLSVGAVETEEGVIFTHEIKSGPASQSYGIEVARIAGLPETLLNRARENLRNNVQQNPRVAAQEPLPLFQAESKPRDYEELRRLKNKLINFDVNNCTPVEALNFVAKLKSENSGA